MAEVERTWFRRVINAEDIPLVWSEDGDFQVAYDSSQSTRAEAFGAWETEIELARRIEASADSSTSPAIARGGRKRYRFGS
jgi:hypothetical protein